MQELLKGEFLIVKGERIGMGGGVGERLAVRDGWTNERMGG